MVKKKIKRPSTQNDNETNILAQRSIKKYCTQKKIKKKKILYGNIKNNEHLRNKKNQNNTANILNSKYNERKSSLSKDQIEICIYDSKRISPTKLSISVKKFYSNNNLKQYGENEHFYIKNKNQDNIHTTNDVEHNSISSVEKKTCYRTKKKKHQSVNYHKPYDFIPQLNKEPRKKKSKSDKTKYSEVFRRKCNFENDEIHLNSVQSQKIVTNETQTNEYLTENYQVIQSTNNAPSIPVMRFYKCQIPSKTIDNEKVNKDMPLISDTTFNSKADSNQSPSKLNSSHKISLNIKHINDSTNNKQQKVTSFFPIRRSARKTKNIVNEEKQIALEKAIESNNEDGLKIAVFPNKGRGVIADKDFTRGEYVVEYAGELVCLQEARKREVIYSQDTTAGCYMYYFKYGSTHYCIDATAESSRLGRLVNHSRYGNLGPKIIELSGLPRIVLIAKMDIKQGEELTYDYGDRSKQSLINHPWLAF